jgi:hypothetical protein
MQQSNQNFAHVRVGFVVHKPFEAVLDIRIEYWLRRLGQLIERRDTPRNHTESRTPPAAP